MQRFARFLFISILAGTMLPACESTINTNDDLPFQGNYVADDFDSSDFFFRLSDSAFRLTFQNVEYDPAYFTIDYPNGDVPKNKGVCCDVIIRCYRKMGIDLQKEVHEDICSDIDAYPNLWGLDYPDKNIDHRRVPNLMKFFERKKAALPITNDPKDYKYGDIVCWDMGGGQLHIGLVSHERSQDRKRFMIIHNVGYGQVVSDFLFKNKIIGHYRYKE